MPRRGDKISIPGDYQYKAYYHGGRIRKFWHRTRLNESEKALDIKSGERILDIGCGSGLLSSFIASKHNINVTAIDANPSAIEFCKSKWQYPNLTFDIGQIDELNFAPESFDKIVLLEVIEHIQKDQAMRLLAKIETMLKPGGRLIITTPNKYSLWPLLEFFVDLLKLTPKMKGEQHEVLYSQRKLKRIITNADLKIVSAKSFFHISPWLALISPAFARWVHRLGMKLNSRFGALLIFVCAKAPVA